eukprot:Lankesteria_metandrocarpae@DN4559_c0_g1_i7.p1
MGVGKNVNDRAADWRTAEPGTAPLRRLEFPEADKIARDATSGPSYCVDELCACNSHSCAVSTILRDGRDFATESRSQFGQNDVPRGVAAERVPYIVPRENRDFATESRSQFGQKDVPRAVAAERVPYVVPRENRDFATESRSQFGQKDVPRGVAAERVPYVVPQESRDFCTENRSQYGQKDLPRSQAHVCPVTRLPPYPAPIPPRQHTFWDKTGKRWV